MKIILWLMLQVISLNAFSATRPKNADIKIEEDSNFFFPLSGNSVMIRQIEPSSKIFGNLYSATAKRIRKIPVSTLSEVGIKEGSEIQGIDVLSNSKKYSYKVGKEVNVVMIVLDSMAEDAKGKPYWNRFNLILSDDPVVLAEMEKREGDFTSITGFAYLGEKRKLQGGSKELLPVKSTPRNHHVFKLSFYDYSEKEPVMHTKIFGHEIFIQADTSGEGKTYIPLIQAGNAKLHTFHTQERLLEDSDTVFPVWNWFAGSKAIFYGEPYKGKNCTSILLLAPKGVSKIQVQCEREE